MVTADQDMTQKPNIVYIHSHDTGRYIQPYGAAVPTPNLQRFADESVLFRQAFCANPTCSPSRASLLSGQYPHSCGMLGLAHRGFEMKDYSQHLAAYLGRQGYHTVLAGLQHEIPHGREAEMGYQEILGTNTSGLEAAVSFLTREKLPGPFFLSVGFYETHRKFWPAGPQEPADRTAPPPGMPDTPETRQDMADFKASARILDMKIGLVLELLKKGGCNENTVVVITTDHGIPFPGYKSNLTDKGIGVMLMLRLPRGQEAGRIVDGMVSQVDVFPTLCELAGVPIPKTVQGTSMMPLIRGAKKQIHDEIFAEMNYHATYEPMRCVRTLRYKYIRRWSEWCHPHLNNADPGLSKTVMVDAGWAETELPAEELYDLMLDPQESCNRISDASYADAIADLRARLNKFMAETNDPLLSGSVPPPAGAKVDPCK